jgi:hypothetical protein
MTERVDKQAEIMMPTTKFIPYGQFTAIDQMYYEPKELQPASHGFSKGRELKPHGENVNLHAKGFVKQEGSISLVNGSLKVNYNTYLYNQVTGYDEAHGRDEVTPVVPMFF